jgi:hypothetical protein
MSGTKTAKSFTIIWFSDYSSIKYNKNYCDILPLIDERIILRIFSFNELYIYLVIVYKSVVSTSAKIDFKA